MSMSLKAELETWATALEAYDEQDFALALDLFSRIADSAKILTNMGLIYATVGEHETAVEYFMAAVNLDNYLAIGYFQCGVSNFILERYDQALTNFECAYLHLRGNEAIDYDQIGLKFKLFLAEILFNKGLSQINLGYPQEGMLDMQAASRQKVTEGHKVIDDAIRHRGEGYTVFSIPIGVLYRPSDIKLKNSKRRDYLGKAKLVAARASSDGFTGFTGAKKRQQASEENGGNNFTAMSEVKTTPKLNRSATVPVSHSDPIAARLTALSRSNTTHQLDANGVRGPSLVAIMATRRAQSVSNPENVPPPPLSTLKRSNSALGRSNTLGRSDLAMGRPGLSARSNSTRAGTAPPRPVTPQGTRAGGIAGIGAGGSRSNDVSNREAGVFSGDILALTPRPSLRKPQAHVEPPPVPPLPPMQALPASPRPGKGLCPFVLPAMPSSRSTASQFYEMYMDVYTDDASRPNSSAVASMGVDVNNTGKGTPRRLGKMSRRPRVHRVTAYDEDEGDDGFVTGECEEVEMANIRVKLHYQDDVRGMTIPPMTTFQAFVERVTTKFGTSPTGLAMKFKDEEGTMITLWDESDFELAVETARESAQGRSEGKIEVWCVDV